MKFGNIVQVETLRHLTKITMLRRPPEARFLQPSIRLRYNYCVTVGGNQARLDARAEFENLAALAKVGYCKRVLAGFYKGVTSMRQTPLC